MHDCPVLRNLAIIVPSIASSKSASSKTRTGSKVTKKYDKARTHYRRVLECTDIDDKIKRNLKKEYDSLNPAEFKRKITKLKDKLLKQNLLKQTVRKEMMVNEPTYGYIKR